MSATDNNQEKIMTVLTRKQAKSLIDSGKAVQVTTMYREHSDKTFGVLNNLESQKTAHYLIGSGDLREEVPETTPTFDRK